MTSAKPCEFADMVAQGKRIARVVGRPAGGAIAPDRDDQRQAVDAPAVVTFTSPREWSLGEVFFALRCKCGIQEPRRVVIEKDANGWTARAAL